MIILNEIDSTNAYIKRLLDEKMGFDGLCVSTFYQTRGKGQLDKIWRSEKGKNALASLLVAPGRLGYTREMIFLFSSAVALAARDFLSARIGDDELKIKWPNDLYYKKKKIGGILIETIISERHWQWAIVGMGININQTDMGIKTASSLVRITGKEWAIYPAIRALAEYVKTHISYREGILEEFKRRMMFVDGYKRIRFKGEDMTVKIGNIYGNGTLSLTTPAGESLLVHRHQDVDWKADEL